MPRPRPGALAPPPTGAAPTSPQRTVRAVFADEAARLLALPDNPGATARAGGGLGRQDALCPLRPERLLGPAHPRPARADGARRSARGAHRRRRRSARPSPAQLRQGRADRGLPPTSRRWSSRKRAARQHRATDRLAQAAPASQTLLDARRRARRQSRRHHRRPCCGCSNATAPPNCRPPSSRRWCATCRIPTPCASPSNVGASSAATRRRWRSVLPAHVQARDAPVRPHALETYDQLKERCADD